MVTIVSTAQIIAIRCFPNYSVSSKRARDFLGPTGLRCAHHVRPEKGKRAIRGDSRHLDQSIGTYFREVKNTRPLKTVEFPSHLFSAGVTAGSCHFGFRE
jgi:hypothetical protein